MKYLLLAIGTRGDVEPFLVVGERLLKKGHEVTAVFPIQFASLAQESRLQFIGLDKAFIEMVDGPIGKRVLGGEGNMLERIKSFYQLWKLSINVNKRLFKQQHDIIETIKPDYIIHSLKATVPLAWGLKNKGKSILLSPIPCMVHPIEGKSSIGFRGKDLGPFLNNLSYKFLGYASIKNLRGYLKKILNEQSSQSELTNVYKGEQAIFTVSPHLINISGLPKQAKYIGYQERDKKQHWAPDSNLEAFVENHPNFLFLTFGSMSNPDPKRKTQAFIEALQKLKIPAIINTASGGLMELGNTPHSILFTKSIPYDWVLPRATAIIHHGGAGTTHLGVKYGCPSLIIPHIIDQYFWNNTLFQLGIGPKGIPVRKINIQRILPLINDLWSNKTYRKNAERIAKQIQKEDFELELLELLEQPISALT